MDENLTEEERKNAWEEFEQEKKGMLSNANVNTNNLQFNQMVQNMLPQQNTINPQALQHS